MSKSTFGLKAIKKETPKWAKYMFRIVLLLNASITAYLGATNLIPMETKFEITVLLNSFVTPLVFGLSKMFGVEVEENEGAHEHADDHTDQQS